MEQQLQVDYVVRIPSAADGGSSPGDDKTLTAFFDFDHWETPNNVNPCADDGVPGVGVNVNGCADRVTFVNTFGASVSFEIGGVKYFLSLNGFRIGEVNDTQFWTTESASNEAFLTASFTSQIGVIPLPASALLLLSGIGGLGAMAGWRRRRAA